MTGWQRSCVSEAEEYRVTDGVVRIGDERGDRRDGEGEIAVERGIEIKRGMEIDEK
jgi:hypothetical protein